MEIAIVLLILLFSIGGFKALKGEKPKGKAMNKKTFSVSDQEIKDALKYIVEDYGKDVASLVEQIYRDETSHFTSGQFLQSLSAGMVASRSRKGVVFNGSNTFPYGWTKFRSLWSNKALAPTGVTEPFKVGDVEFRYVVFPSIKAAMIPVAEAVKKGGAVNWGGTPDYADAIKQITPKFTNSLT